MTGLNGSTSTLASSNIKLWIDTDKTEGVNYVDFLAVSPIAYHDLDADVGGDLFNIGFGTTDFSAGQYDFLLAAYDDADALATDAALASVHIVVNVI